MRLSGVPAELPKEGHELLDLGLESGSELTHTKRYCVLECVGEGGMGMVYRAHDPVLERQVALKVMKPGVPQVERRRFRREAIFGARFCHPSIVRVYDMGKAGIRGVEWFTMEYLPGTDMEQVVDRARARGSARPMASVLEVFRQVLAALQYSHDCGVVHRDVKPANIFVARDPNTGFVTCKLLDFGIAKDLDGPDEREQAICGDPRYMAPEQTQLAKGLDGRADIYSAGVSLFEIIVGQHPYEHLMDAPLTEMLRAHRDLPLPRPSEAVARRSDDPMLEILDEVVARACAKNPEDRYADAKSMYRDMCARLSVNPRDP
jgi:serine/threonine-protein kinase